MIDENILVAIKCDILNKEIREKLQEDLEILEILKDYLFFCPSFYVDQANWGKEYISMSYLDKTWTEPEIYEKVKQWCFKNKIRGTEEKD